MTRGRVLAPLAQQLLQSERGVGGAAPRPEAALRLVVDSQIGVSRTLSTMAAILEPTSSIMVPL